jgi:hypothetical protein
MNAPGIREIDRLSGVEFGRLAADLLRAGYAVRFRAAGDSMRPFLRDGDVVDVEPAPVAEVRIGDILLYQRPDGTAIAHRVARRSRGAEEPMLEMQGDARRDAKESARGEQVLGRVVRLRRGDREIALTGAGRRIAGWLWGQAQPFTGACLRRWKRWAAD